MGKQDSNPVITATYDAATNRISFAGSGWDFAPVALLIRGPSGDSSFLVGMRTGGVLDSAYMTAQGPGSYTVEATQDRKGHNDLAASAAVTVP